MCAHVFVWIVAYVLFFAGMTQGDCILPKHPAHGRHEPQDLDCPEEVPSRHPACEGTPGTTAPEDWILTVRCDTGYRSMDLATAEIPSVCTDGVWSRPTLPECGIDHLKNDREKCALPSYPQYGQYRLLKVECGLYANDQPGPGSMVPSDCIIMYSCDPGYQLARAEEYTYSVCHNKTWNPPTKDTVCEKALDFNQLPSSDQSPAVQPRTTSTTTHTPLTECVIPEAAQSRRFCALSPECEDCDAYPYNRLCSISPGAKVKDNTAVRMSCVPGYSLRTPEQKAVSVCVRGSWFPPMPECLKQCRPLSSDSLLLKCWHGPSTVDCSRPSLPNTTANFQCRPSYSEFSDLAATGIYTSTITCRPSGRWSNENLPPCKPACGVSQEVGTYSPTIVDGKDATIGAFPWHAGLYYREVKGGVITWDNKCGGSLISDRIILTAAHCVAHLGDKVSDLRIALGKYYRSWDQDERSQVKRNVSAIKYPPEYNPQTYSWDIALVLLSEKITFGEYVMPVCRVFKTDSNYIQNNTVYVVGWGKTSSGGTESETLLYNEATVTSLNVCRKKLPSAIVTFEKFCGYKTYTESVVQKGDSGGGVTAVYNGLHYIVGIVSVKFNEVSMFTNVTWPTHITWLEYEMRYLSNNFR